MFFEALLTATMTLTVTVGDNSSRPKTTNYSYQIDELKGFPSYSCRQLAKDLWKKEYAERPKLKSNEFYTTCKGRDSISSPVYNERITCNILGDCQINNI